MQLLITFILYLLHYTALDLPDLVNVIMSFHFEIVTQFKQDDIITKITMLQLYMFAIVLHLINDIFNG